MTLQNKLKVQVDQPTWEWCRFFPNSNSALSEMTCIETPGNRYMYMLQGSTFWRYDTMADAWGVLAPPVTAPLVILSLKYLSYGGFIGQVLPGSTSTTFVGACLQGKRFIGKKVRIIAGVGAGQERTITGHADATIWDSGLATAASATAITDNLKKWEVNQWSGYFCKIVNGVGVTQRRKILYNSATVLTFTDTNWQQLAPQENMGFSTAPTIASLYTIESNVITVTPAWDVTPTSVSKFRLISGVICCVSTSATAPFVTSQVYDIEQDYWVTRTVQQGLALAAGTASNDVSFVLLDEGEVPNGAYDSGMATVIGSTARTLGDTTKTWTVDQWANYEVVIVGGTGVSNKLRILGNTASVLYTDGVFLTTPDATSIYAILSLENQAIVSGFGLASMFGFNTDIDQATQGFNSSGGLANAMSVRSPWWYPIACTATRAVTGIYSINPVPTAGGTGYVVGDVLTPNQTGSGGQLVVTSTDNNGVVTGLKLQKSGTGYGVAAGRTTTGGTGTLCTFEITAVTTIGTVTTAFNHCFQAGDLITFAGATDAAWNVTTYVLGVSSLTTFDIPITAAATAAALTAQSVTVIVDASKNWVVNEHAGAIVQLSTVGTAGTSQVRRILSNTATALTIYGTNITQAVEGTSRYLIQDPFSFGRAVQEKFPTRTNTGWATSGSGTTLVDTTKTWKGNEWVGYKVWIVSGTGYNIVEATVTSNAHDTLTVSGGFGFTPDATTKYIIEDTFGTPTTVTNTTNAVITDTTKLWFVNQFAGFRIRITAGEGLGQEMTITSNTATALTITGVFGTAPVALSSMYTILGCPVRGMGHELTWASCTTVNPGRYILSPRGQASNAWDRFDITTNTWELAFVCGPDTETFSLGTMYAYDGKDRIYIQKDATGKLFYMDLNLYKIDGAGFVPYTLNSSIGAAVNGNRMEILQTTDGLKYLYIMKHTGAALSATGGGTEWYRTLIFY